MSVAPAAGVCIAGGGPAGTALAIRLARLGHRVVLVDRGRARPGHLGESLSAGVLTQLDLLGARDTIGRAGFAEFRCLRTAWQDGTAAWREFDGEAGLLVERARFAAVLRDVARACGVRVLEPATIRESRYEARSWHLRIGDAGSETGVEAAVLALAGGRAATAARGRRATGPRTLAVSGVWQGTALPTEPGIEAGISEWYWGMPLPDRRYGLTVFVDPRHFRGPAEPLPAAFARLVARSRLFGRCVGAPLVGGVHAADATPYLDVTPAERHMIKIGEAALALDPLSSSGVQRAVQGALAAGVVINTLLKRPSDAEIALAFYRHHLAAAADRHRGWTAAFYGAAERQSRFWCDRASGGEKDDAAEPAPGAVAVPRPDLPIALAGEARFAPTPCIVGDFVAMRLALHHPRLAEPVAFVAGHDLVPLLAQMMPGRTVMMAGALVASWSGRVDLRPALSILEWLLQRGVLISPPHLEPPAPRMPTEGVRAI